MANHGYGVSFPQHSQISNKESFGQYNFQTLATLSKGTSYLMGGHTSSPFVSLPPCPDQCNIRGGGYGGRKINIRGSGNSSANMRRKLKQPKKPKGRPPGAKNKPKPPITDDEALKHVIIEISAGCDVVEELIKFAEIHDVGLTVLSGSGSVTNVTLSSQTFSSHASPPLTLRGTFTMLTLSGTFLKSHVSASSSSSLPNPNPNPSSFHVVVPPASPGYSCFTICLADGQGQISGGVIAGGVMAASLVVVVAALYKKPRFHRVLNNNETNNNNSCPVADLSDVDEAVLKCGTNNTTFLALLASFNNAMSRGPLNSQAPNLPPS